MKTRLNLVSKKYLYFLLGFMSFGILSAQMSDPEDGENSVVTSFKEKTIEWGPCPPFMPEGCNIAVLHGDPSQSNSDVLFKVEGKSSIPNHWHNSSERMVLLSGKMTVSYKGETTQTMNVGDYAFGPAKKPHQAKCISKDPCILYIGFGVPVDAFAVED